MSGFQENGQGVIARGNLNHSDWCCGRFDRLPDGITEEFLDGLFHGAGTESFVDATPEEKLECFFGNSQIESLLAKSGEFLVNRKSANLSLGIWTQRFENNLLVESSDQLGSEKSVEFRKDGSFQRREWESRLTEELLRADVAGAYDVESGKIVGSMIGQSDPGRIEHLQEEIPDQAVGLFNLIEKKNAMPMLGKHFSQTTGAAGLVTHKQLHVVEVEEFGHVEPEHRIIPEEVAGEFQCQFCLPHPGRPEEKKRTERLALWLQSELAAFQHGTHAGNGMILAIDFGKQMGLKAGKFFNLGIHGLVTGLVFFARSHWRIA